MSKESRILDLEEQLANYVSNLQTFTRKLSDLNKEIQKANDVNELLTKRVERLEAHIVRVSGKSLPDLD